MEESMQQKNVMMEIQHLEMDEIMVEQLKLIIFVLEELQQRLIHALFVQQEVLQMLVKILDQQFAVMEESMLQRNVKMEMLQHQMDEAQHAQ